jgi:hypothetical protein
MLISVTACITASADVIWEPGDAFYRNHFNQCDSLGRSYTANGSDGSITVWKEPGSREKVTSVENGSTFYVSFVYTDKEGKKWGVVQFGYDEAGKVKAVYTNDAAHTGWIPMTDLTVVYDYISFNEDHKNEFQTYKGDYKTFTNGDKIVFWSYPCSGVINWTTSDIKEDFRMSNAYTDTEGRQWGFVERYFGARNSWVCISDPTNEKIPAVNTNTAPSVIPSPESAIPSSNETQMKGGLPAAVLLVILVGALVVVTAILVRLFWKKN